MHVRCAHIDRATNACRHACSYKQRRTHDIRTHFKISVTYGRGSFLYSEHKSGVKCVELQCVKKKYSNLNVWPDSPQRFVFHWRTLDLLSAEVQFGFSITLIKEGWGRTWALSLHLESLILNLDCTSHVDIAMLEVPNGSKWFIVLGSLHPFIVRNPTYKLNLCFMHLFLEKGSK